MKTENLQFKLVQPYILLLEQNLKTLVEENKNELSEDIVGFLFAKPKRIRPMFMFLCAKALNEEIDEDIINTATALELLHSATLIHDDILDESGTRRKNPTFYKKFGSKHAVILGDYLLSLCLCALSRVESNEILSIFSQNITKTINGEINQFNSLFEFQSVEDYMNKTTAKTANLFVCAAQSFCALKQTPKWAYDSLCAYALEFGTLFQLENDLHNTADDIKNGIFTLCSIYFKQENPTCDIMFIKDEQIIKYKQKAQLLLSQIVQRAINLLDDKLEPSVRQIFVNLAQSYLTRT